MLLQKLLLFLMAPLIFGQPWYKKKSHFYGRVRKFQEEIKKNPLDTFKSLRNESPVFSLGKIPLKSPFFKNKKSYFVGNYDDVVTVLSHPEIFSVRLYSDKMDKAVGSPHMLSRDNTDFNLSEKLLLRKLMPRTDYSKIKKDIEQMTKTSLENALKKGNTIDIAQTISRLVPAKIVKIYFGLYNTPLEKIYEWSKISQHNFFHNIPSKRKTEKKSKKAAQEIFDEIYKTLRKPNKIPKNSIFGRLVTLSEEMSNQRIATNLLGMTLASIETTHAALIKSLDYILKNPKIYERAKKLSQSSDDKNLKVLILESLRFSPQTSIILRYTEEDFKLKGIAIPKDSVVFVGLQSAMFDVKRFSNPRAFSLERNPQSYLHFGYGQHKCLGDHLAIFQITEIIKNIFTVEKNIDLNFSKKTKIDFQSGPFPESYIVKFIK